MNFNRLFKKDFKYNNKLVKKLILKTRLESTTERRRTSIKQLIFMMMKDVVVKNINNYFNLLGGTNCRDIPEFNEVVTECYIVFDKCLNGFKITKTSNFYFYFNKALSRNFFKEYRKEVTYTTIGMNNAELFNNDFRVHEYGYSTDLLIETWRFSDVEKRIINSKLNKQTSEKFLSENPDITNNQYTVIIKNIKDKLIKIQQDDNEIFE